MAKIEQVSTPKYRLSDLTEEEVALIHCYLANTSGSARPSDIGNELYYVIDDLADNNPRISELSSEFGRQLDFTASHSIHFKDK